MKKEIKAKLEKEHSVESTRSSIQVLCNGGIGAVIALVACWLSYQATEPTSSSLYCLVHLGREGGESPLTVIQRGISATGLSASEWVTLQSYLFAGFLAHYACCTADTWASELGILSKSPPRLITTGRTVCLFTFKLHFDLTLIVGTYQCRSLQVRMGESVFLELWWPGLELWVLESSPSFFRRYSR